MGDKNPNAEYWVLGAQFLHNYYTIYDFQKHQIGLVESMTSAIGKGGVGGPSKTLVKSGPEGEGAGAAGAGGAGGAGSDEAASGESAEKQSAEGKKDVSIGAPPKKAVKKVVVEKEE